ncbi:hypothetical protein BC938DRAFT_483488 [Jimgerdemannia flammicorona]|uniref:Uncharacterized protein n=1 Tax=Jimgerdemannia flammicorona TaxID=994334 RepID=A0A433QBX4_9FUNG|nr:hypothetical protein BC938DRAFT_483488 [Jimgerdemannia flammicorona]
MLTPPTWKNPCDNRTESGSVNTMADCLYCAEKSSHEGLDCTQHCRVNAGRSIGPDRLYTPPNQLAFATRAELCDTTARIMALQNMDVLTKVTPITIETAEKCAEMWYDGRFAFAVQWCRVSFFVLCTSNPYPNHGPHPFTPSPAFRSEKSCAQSCRNLCAQLREIQEKMAS